MNNLVYIEMELAEIVKYETEKDACILMDSGAVQTVELGKGIFEARTENELDYDLIRETELILDQSRRLLDNYPNIVIMDGVYREMGGLKQVIAAKQKFLREIMLTRLTRQEFRDNFDLISHKSRSKRGKHILKQVTLPEDPLSKVYNLSDAILRTAINRGTLPRMEGISYKNDEKYKSCEELVLFLSQEFDLKNKEHLPKEVREIESKKDKSIIYDEQLVACAFYNALVNKQRTAIVSKDMDIYRLAVMTSYVLNRFLLRTIFGRRLIEHPVLTYTVDYGEIRLTFSTEEDNYYDSVFGPNRGSLKNYSHAEINERLSSWQKKSIILRTASILDEQ